MKPLGGKDEEMGMSLTMPASERTPCLALLFLYPQLQTRAYQLLLLLHIYTTVSSTCHSSIVRQRSGSIPTSVLFR